MEYESFKEKIKRIVAYNETFKANGEDRLESLIDTAFGDTDRYNKGGGRIIIASEDTQEN
jgi:hypothetical protein